MASGARDRCGGLAGVPARAGRSRGDLIGAAEVGEGAPDAERVARAGSRAAAPGDPALMDEHDAPALAPAMPADPELDTDPAVLRLEPQLRGGAAAARSADPDVAAPTAAGESARRSAEREYQRGEHEGGRKDAEEGGSRHGQHRAEARVPAAMGLSSPSARPGQAVALGPQRRLG